MHRISDDLRKEVLEQIQRGVPAREIQQQCRDKLLAEYMSTHRLTDKHAALKLYCKSQPSRDFYLSLQDIGNIRREADRLTWLLAQNPQSSVLIWAAQNSDSVAYVKEQKPIPGTPDDLFLIRKQQAAAKKDNAGSSQASVAQRGKQKGKQRTSVAAADSDDDSISEEEDMDADDEGEDAGDAIEPAFNGADDSLDRPESINLDRDDSPALVQQSFNDGTEKYTFDPCNWEPFSIAIMQPWQVEAAMKYGHGRTLQLDSTFGCNTQKFPLFTLLAVDEHHKGVPIAYCICSQERTELIVEFLEAVFERVSGEACACLYECYNSMVFSELPTISK